MANESGSKVSSSADSYIGSFISLISKYEIRYEGILYFLNTQDSTIGLKNVRSYGTEGRKKDGPQIPPNDKVYEYILFRGSDIKDLQVKSSPAQTEEQIHDDPAIIQSHYAGGPSSSSVSASVGGVALTESSHCQDTPALTSRAYPGALPSYQSGAQVGPSAHSQTAQIAGVPSFAMPMYWPGYNGTSISISHAPQLPVPFQPTSTMSLPPTIQNQLRAPEIQASTTLGLTNTSECVTPVPPLVTSNFVYPNFSPTLAPKQCSTSTDMPSSLSLKPSLLSHSASMTANRLTMPSFPSSYQDVNTIEAPIVGKAVSDQVSVLPIQSPPFSASSIVGSTSGPLLTPPPTLLTPDQLAQPRSPMLSSTQKLYLDQKDMGNLTPSTAISTPVLQAPLLPLPLSAHQTQNSTTQFTEEFDFIAMNEKFKKDEVWGYLGKAKQRDKTEETEDNAIGQSMGDREGYGMVTKLDAKPAYSKDDFFDTISCNSLARGGRNGQNRFSERMKMDTETFGNFQQRSYGGYGAGHGETYRGSYNRGRGRGYGYGGRGRGGNTPF